MRAILFTRPLDVSIDDWIHDVSGSRFATAVRGSPGGSLGVPVAAGD